MRSKLIAALAFLAVLFFGAPVYAATPTETQGCAAYTYKGATAEGNVCAEFPNKPGKDDPYDCGDLSGKTLVLLNPSDDPWGLDADKDGWGCEGPNEGPGDPEPNPSESSSSPAPKPTKTTSNPTPIQSSSSAPNSVSAEDNEDDEPQLPVTGPSGWALGAAGILLAGLGVTAFALTRRRNTKFTV